MLVYIVWFVSTVLL